MNKLQYLVFVLFKINFFCKPSILHVRMSLEVRKCSRRKNRKWLFFIPCFQTFYLNDCSLFISKAFPKSQNSLEVSLTTKEPFKIKMLKERNKERKSRLLILTYWLCLFPLCRSLESFDSLKQVSICKTKIHLQMGLTV